MHKDEVEGPVVTREMEMNKEKTIYPGLGTVEDPYVVSFAESDADNPMQWSAPFRWLCMMATASCMMSGTLSVSSYTSGFRGMAEEFHVGTELLALGQFTFLLGLALGSIVWPSIGDLLSRKWIIVATMLAFSAFGAGVAGANSIATAIVCRYFAGFFAACVQVLGPASVRDVFAPKDMAVPFTVAATMPFLGPSLGPLLGGYIVQYSGNWRNVNWFSFALSSCLGLAYIAMPELYAPAILRKRAKRLTKETGQIHVSVHDKGKVFVIKKEAKRFLLFPFALLFREPVVAVFSLYIAFLYGILNLFFSAIPYIFQKQRHWSLGNSGLPYISLIIGLVLSIPAAIVANRPFKKAVMRGDQPTPEMRLPNAMVGACLAAISLFWLGWTAAPLIPWPAPIIPLGIFAFSQIGITMAAFTYLSDVYKFQVGAAFQALNLLRFLVGGAFPLFSSQMYDKLGAGISCTILGCLLVLFIPAPVGFYFFGPKLRAMSKYAPTAPPPSKASSNV